MAHMSVYPGRTRQLPNMKMILPKYMNIADEQMVNESYTVKEVCYLLHIKKERIRQWIKYGYVNPKPREGKSQGHPYVFSRYGLYEIKLLTEMVDVGIKRYPATQLFPPHFWWSSPRLPKYIYYEVSPIVKIRLSLLLVKHRVDWAIKNRKDGKKH